MTLENVILDLDNTLLCAEVLMTFPFHDKGMKQKATKFDIHDCDGYYMIFERPFLKDFLDYIFTHFRVAVWTAASKDYALFVINNIILANHPNRVIDFIMFGYHCDVSKRILSGTKDLRLLFDIISLDGYKRSNTVIIDDLEQVYKIQPRQAIQIKPFEFHESGSDKDTALVKTMKLLNKRRNKI
jgi:TFIIF-interacting CTD phosphatase-like protein